MALKTVILFLQFSVLVQSSLVDLNIHETGFTQKIIHPIVNADSQKDSSPFVPDQVMIPLPPRTVVSVKCRCGIYDSKSKIRSNVTMNTFKNVAQERNNSTAIFTKDIQEIAESKTKSSLDENVAGGGETGINQFPWIVALIYRNENSTGEHFCGGVLISSKLVLTATHCLLGKVAEKTEVWLNERDLLLTTETPNPTLKIKVSKLIPHPSYNLLMYYNDISLILLSEAVDVTKSHLRPICLPPHDNYDAIKDGGKTKGITAGWGQISFQGPKSDKLLHVEVPLVTNQECKEESEAWYRDRVTEYMMCAGDLKNGGADSCPGDSGGPLFVELDEKQHQLIGLVSWGDRCAEPRKPGVYTNVAKYIRWINNVEARNDVKENNYHCGM